jgi:ACS family glucarate transporter-like MFS transporter
MLSGWGWRLSFVYLGLIGVVWAVVWLIWFRDHPAQTVAKNDSASAASSQIGFGEVFRSGRMWLTMAQYFASNFTFFICLSWMLPYLKEQYKLSDTEAAGYAMIPLLFGATSQWISGFVVDVLYRSGLRGWSRRIPAIIGFAFGVAGLVFITQVSSPTAAVACFTLATFGVDMTISPSWSYCMDIGGKNAGAVSGSMNMIGNLGSVVSANAFPWLYGLTGSANAYFVGAALLNVGAVACWLWMRLPSQNLAENPEFGLSPESVSSN